MTDAMAVTSTVEQPPVFNDGGVNIAGGDFIGRPKISERELIQISGNVSGDVIMGNQITIIQQFVIPLEKLRGRITLAITFAEAMDELEKISYTAVHYSKNFFQRIFQRTLFDDGYRYREYTTSKDLAMYLEKVTALGNRQLELEKTGQDARGLQEDINTLSDYVNVAISSLHSRFIGYVRSTGIAPKLYHTMVIGIGHEDLRKLGLSHLEAINTLCKELDLVTITGPNFDILTNDGTGELSILKEIELRTLEIRKLIRQDESRSALTVFVVIAYIALVIFLFGWLIYQLYRGVLDETTVSLINSQELLLLGVPMSVILWGLIGSFAAMLFRFNKEPIYNFGETVKWLLTRPIQGMILGIAFYIVLQSGLFVFGQGTPSSTDPAASQYLTNVLVFFIGFSDRFADQVFKSLIRRFSEEPKADETPKETEKRSKMRQKP